MNEIAAPENVSEVTASICCDLPGQPTMDECSQFLEFVEGAREELARALFRRKSKARWSAASLSQRVDRNLIGLLFTRMCEERGIHASASRQESRVPGLPNTGEFEGISVPKALLAKFVEQLSREKSSWFSGVIPVEMLGAVYERFLGSTIVLGRGGPRFESTATRKSHGVYYTPRYIVDYIVEETVGILVSGKSPQEMSEFRFLDPACGSGRFLLRIYQRIVEEHIEWFRKHPEEQTRRVTKDAEGNIHLPSRMKRDILTNCIYGVDLDAEAVEVTKLSLYLKLLEGDATVAGKDSVAMPLLSANIKSGNSLVAGGQHSPDGDKASRRFVWEREFPAVFHSGGFDVVLGNPPYGAELTPAMRTYLADRFDVGSTDTAALMMIHALRDLTRAGGMNGFIVPKAFTYSSNWQKVRDELLGGITEIVDVGKVWPQVRLEQVIYFVQKGTPTTPLKPKEGLNGAPSYTNRKRTGERFLDIAVVEKEHCRSFGFLLNGISQDELRVGLKILSAGSPLSDFVSNTRGAMFQDRVRDTARGRRVIGGRQVQRYHIAGEKGFVSPKTSLENNAFVVPESILVQNIIAHIENPIDHIKITAALADEKLAREIVVLDTVNQLTNQSKLSSYFFLAILNSRLMNWYVYRFIYAKAIRTMHFDGPVTSRIPIPPITEQNSDFCDEIVAAAKVLQSNQTRADAERIESVLHRLYGLSAEDVEVIERGMPHGEKHSRAVAATFSLR